jgi:hypothetical protein
VNGASSTLGPRSTLLIRGAARCGTPRPSLESSSPRGRDRGADDSRQDRILCLRFPALEPGESPEAAQYPDLQNRVIRNRRYERSKLTGRSHTKANPKDNKYNLFHNVGITCGRPRRGPCLLDKCPGAGPRIICKAPDWADPPGACVVVRL